MTTDPLDVEGRRVLDELTRALPDLPPLGEWIALAACGPLVDVEVWTADTKPDADELALVERVCRRCPVRTECRSYALSTPVYGVWGGVWHDGRLVRRAAA